VSETNRSPLVPAIAGGVVGAVLTAAVLLFAAPQLVGSRIVRHGMLADPQILVDAADALRDRQLVLCFAPAYGQRPLAELVAPHLRPGMMFVLACGSAGTLEVAQALTERGIDVREDVILGETVTLPQSARMTGPARVRIRLDSCVRLAAFPARNAERLYERLNGTIRFRPSPHVLDTGINNVNFLIHPVPMLLNYAAVEREDGRLSIMNEGMTDAVLRSMDALDAEKMALAEALGLQPISIDDLYREGGSSPHIYRATGEPFALKDRIWPRYVDEDVPFGTVMLSSLGRQLGVPMPVCDAVNTMLSVAARKDFNAIGRTTSRLGLDGMSADQMRDYLYQGAKPQP
jgi:opine dehydrogenase